MVNKYWRKCMRPGLLFFSVLAQGRAAGPLKPMRARRAHKHDHHVPRQLWPLHSSTAPPPPKSTAHAGRYCLPLPTAGCLPITSFSSSPSSPDAEDKEESIIQTDLSYAADDNAMMMKQELSRSHSCSKLQLGLVPSLKSMLLHRSNSHSHLHHHKYHWRGYILSNTGVHVDMTRSWSSLSTLARRQCEAESHNQKTGSCSGHTKQEAAAKCTSGGKSGKRTPKGHVAMYVEAGTERWVVPIPYLSHPQFEALLERAEREFGFRQNGGLIIPCSLRELLETLESIESNQPGCA